MPSFEQLQQDFARHLRNPAEVAVPPGLEDRRVQIYRELLFNNVAGLLAGNFPVIRRLLDGNEWQHLVRRFYVEHAAHTPLFHELGSEFVRFLGEHPEHWGQRRPFLHELAHYEWVELALDLADGDIESAATGTAGGDPIAEVPVASPVAWVLGYRYPVHLIRVDHQPVEAPEQPTWLLIYRNRADRVQFQALEPLAARLLTLTQESEGKTGRELVMQLAAEIGHPRPEELIEPARSLFHGWMQRDVIVGTRVATRTSL
jgi:hypothetical protein